jgi:hypothetical protein
MLLNSPISKRYYCGHIHTSPDSSSNYCEIGAVKTVENLYMMRNSGRCHNVVVDCGGGGHF